MVMLESGCIAWIHLEGLWHSGIGVRMGCVDSPEGSWT